jgi:TPR repeat protein
MLTAPLIRARLRAASGRPRDRLSLANKLEGKGSGIAAARHIAAAAQEGLPEAQTRLGQCYLHGRGVPVNLGEARHWLDLAGRAGDIGALTELASLALRGITGSYDRGPFQPADPGGPADYHLAAGLARRAAKAGSAEAKALLAFILRLIPSMAEAPGEADALYLEASEAGWPLGQLGHAITLIRDGSPEAMRDARALLSAAAASGMPTAHFLTGAMAEAGVGGPRNPEAAAAHYRIAAEHGHSGAKTRLGLALLTGGDNHNPAEGESWLRRAALDGDSMAAAVLGDFHASPYCESPNLEEAAHWYRRAAELSHPGSAHVLARAISAGAEGTPDLREITAWLETAIEQGETAAWPDLGGLIASASLPPDQLPELHEWLQRMIREDHPAAGFYVGVCVNNGIGTPADEPLARQYYLWAAGEGVIEGMVAAAEMLLNGRGGPADPDLARALFEYAGERDHPGATYALGVIAGEDHEIAMGHFRRAADLGHPKARLLCDATTRQEMPEAVPERRSERLTRQLEPA